ncbi:unnamed protein product [Peronospora belbahrii]|uniref:BAR domain-containing protein n=1 Tax=Peronospora belbahrii TaxID=622444 RepID=A0AAU9KQ24_9STRA|nr:unnamed protein product [Peronospora belbahrii]CAH0520427.1 unnamed protein product [Peronospora belbahrii]
MEEPRHGRYELLQTQLEVIERNGRVLEAIIEKMIAIRMKQETFLHEFAKSMNDLAIHEDCVSLAKCLGELSECGQKMENDCHDIMIERPEMEIVQIWTQIQEWGIGPMKKLVEDGEKVMKIEAKLQKEYNELKQGSSVKEKDKKLRMLLDQKRRVDNVHALLETHMENFDRYRIDKMKKIVTELARSQAFYHAKGLELFAVPCQAIATLDITEMKGTTQVASADAS